MIGQNIKSKAYVLGQKLVTLVISLQRLRDVALPRSKEQTLLALVTKVSCDKPELDQRLRRWFTEGIAQLLADRPVLRSMVLASKHSSVKSAESRHSSVKTAGSKHLEIGGICFLNHKESGAASEAGTSST